MATKRPCSVCRLGERLIKTAAAVVARERKICSCGNGPAGKHEVGAAKAKVPLRKSEFAKGARAAADVAISCGMRTTHHNRIDDVILGKLNLTDRKPRKNPFRVDDYETAWTLGFVVGVIGMHSRLLEGSDAAGVRAVVKDAGITLAKCRAAGVGKVDLAKLRRAGVR